MNRKELLNERKELLYLKNGGLYIDLCTERLYVFGLYEIIEEPDLLYYYSSDGYTGLLDAVVENLQYFNLPYEKLDKIVNNLIDFFYDNGLHKLSINQLKENKQIRSFHKEIIEEMKNIQKYVDTDREEKDLMKQYKNNEYYSFIQEVIDKQLDNINMQLEKYEDEYLDKLVELCLEKIRKKMKMKKRYFYSIFRNIKVYWDREGFLGDNTSGDYNYKDRVIRIDKKYIIPYTGNKLTHKNNSELQKELNNQISGTLIHELIHHFVKEEFDMENLIHVNGDASPIFMGILYWVTEGQTSNGYECFKEFKETDTYRKMMECKTYDELEILCIRLITKTNRIMEKSLETKNRWITPEWNCFRYKEESFYFRKMAEEVLTGEKLQEFYNMNLRDFCIGIDWCNFVEENRIQ